MRDKMGNLIRSLFANEGLFKNQTSRKPSCRGNFLGFASSIPRTHANYTKGCQMTRLALASAAAIVFMFSVQAQAGDWVDAKEAQSRASQWLEKMGGKLVFDYKAADKEPGFVGAQIAGSQDTMYVLSNKGWQVTLGFKGKISPDDSVESLNKRLAYVALDNIPTPGLEVKGWAITPRTPVSSFHEGVEILEFKNGIAKIAIKTKCFCLSGAVKKELLGPLPADAGLPEGTYFQLRQNIPLEVTFEAPLGFRP
jgi:hypothetical protein